MQIKIRFKYKLRLNYISEDSKNLTISSTYISAQIGSNPDPSVPFLVKVLPSLEHILEESSFSQT